MREEPTREPANMQKLALAALGAALLIPAGLVGIFTGLKEMSQTHQQPGELIHDLMVAAQALAPWCQPMVCLLFGLALLGSAVLLLGRGLQSIWS